jgi:hypothetical protein
MSANRYMSFTAVAPDIRDERYRESTVRHNNIPTEFE